ncbi:MAG: hypothetical protein KUG77_09450 [Nannocystaceae bacterium]|nr:hypothetical protein [Nannocystaceae bacterium]
MMFRLASEPTQCWGVLADEVSYQDMLPWPQLSPGVSMVLQANALGALENDEPEAWCAATASYAEGLFGSPGAPGGCP